MHNEIPLVDERDDTIVGIKLNPRCDNLNFRQFLEVEDTLL